MQNEYQNKQVTSENTQNKSIANKTVDEVKQLVKENKISAEEALRLEKEGKNRTTLIRFLEDFSGGSEKTYYFGGRVEGEPRKQIKASSHDQALNKLNN